MHLPSDARAENVHTILTSFLLILLPVYQVNARSILDGVGGLEPIKTTAKKRGPLFVYTVPYKQLQHKETPCCDGAFHRG